MKRFKTYILLIIFLAISLAIIGINVAPSKNSEITLVQEEIDNIKTIKLDEVSKMSLIFDTSIIIRDFSDGRISFEINILNPTKTMNQVIISAFLGEKVLNYINTPHSLVTNIIAVKNADESFKKNFNLFPNGQIKGITASSNMIYFKNVSLNDVLKVMPYILIKISWLDENNKPKIEYVKYPREKYIIMTK